MKFNFKKTEKAVPIITEVGKVWGRDAIFLDEIKVINESTFELTGEFNGSLCSNLEDTDDRKYKITFNRVHLFKMIELDFDQSIGESSFDLIENSKEVDKMLIIENNEYIGKIDNTYKHYVFRTYDTVFEVIGLDFDLILI